jgi:hypothetical protein
MELNPTGRFETWNDLEALGSEFGERKRRVADLQKPRGDLSVGRERGMEVGSVEREVGGRAGGGSVVGR